MLEIKENPDKEYFDKITAALIERGGYCPCAVFDTEDTKCMCKEFREQTTEGYCHCKRYYKEEVNV